MNRTVRFPSSGQMTMLRILLLILSLFCTLEYVQSLTRPVVVGHRGTAYLPELTLASQSMAHAFGANIIEIDVCVSRDDQLIVIHGNRIQIIRFKLMFSFYIRSLFECCQ